MHASMRWVYAGVALALVAYAADGPGAEIVWPAGGVRVSTEPWQLHHDVLPDGDGGAWIATTAMHPRVQRLGADGARLWGDAGSVLSVAATESTTYLGIVPDGQGGVIAGWTERRRAGTRGSSCSGWTARAPGSGTAAPAT